MPGPPVAGSAATTVGETAGGRPWGAAVLWLVTLGPFFFLSYGFANWMAAQRAHVPAVVFAWERAIPFVPWTIVPYWSIDLFYAASFFTCCLSSTPIARRELRTHGLRLLAAQLVSVACFLAFPLRFSFDRPHAGGLFGKLFDLLAGFDKPFNQAPSLHISLLLLLWVRYRQVTPRRWRWLLHGWAALIGVSVLTTWQHHFVDLPTGLWAGALCLWLFPDDPRLRPQLVSPSAAESPLRRAARRKLAWSYAAGAALLAALACLGGVALWLAWPAAALALVSLAYGWLGAKAFQKRGDGSMELGALLLLLPYLAGAWLNSRWWTRRGPRAQLIAPGLWLGRFPAIADLVTGEGPQTLRVAWLDLTAELPASPAAGIAYASVPLLDQVPPSADELASAVAALAALPRPTLLACALGYGRSAAVAAAWLLHERMAPDVDAALAMVAAGRPGVVSTPAHREALLAWWQGARRVES